MALTGRIEEAWGAVGKQRAAWRRASQAAVLFGFFFLDFSVAMEMEMEITGWCHFLTFAPWTGS